MTVNPGLIDNSGTLFQFQANLTVIDTQAFQLDAFQNNAFQVTKQFFVDGSPTLFTPQLPKFVVVPAPTGAAFNPFAFQNDAFQTTGGIDGSPVVFTPSDINLGIVGAKQLFPGLLDVSGVLFTPMVGEKVVADLIDGSPSVFTPSLPAGGLFVRFDADVLWDSATVLWDDPSVSWDSAGSGILIASGQVFTPSVTESVTPDLLDGSAQLFAPQANLTNLFMPLLNGVGFVFDPVEAMLHVSPDLLDGSGTVYEFTFPPVIEPDLLDGSAELYIPNVNPPEVDIPFLNAAGFVFTPMVAEKVTMPLIDQSGVLFVCFVGKVVTPDLLDGSPEVFTPSLERLFFDLIDGSGQVLEPGKINTFFVQVVRLDDSPDQFLDASGVAFGPVSVTRALPKTVFAGLIAGSPILLQPRIPRMTQNVLTLRARYTPVIRLHARTAQVIRNRAMVSQQGG